MRATVQSVVSHAARSLVGTTALVGALFLSAPGSAAEAIATSLGKQLTVLVSNYQGAQLLAQLGATYAAGCDQCALATDPSSNAFVKAVVDRSAKSKVHVVTVWNRPEDIRP